MRLTEREEQVIDGIAIGLTDREIAGRLGISPFTVKTHVRLILAKLGAVNRTQAALTWSRNEANALAQTRDIGERRPHIA